MENKFLYLSNNDVEKIINLNCDMVMDTVSKALIELQNEQAIQPEKISQIFDESFQNRINCMPAWLKNEKICGVKWVSVFPSNKQINKKNVEGYTLVSDTVSGNLKYIINATKCTSIRTAAVGTLAAKYLAKNNPKSIGFIGAGEEARAHFKLMKYQFPDIKRCYVSSRTKKSVDNFISELSQDFPTVDFINCQNYYKNAVINSDIVITAISSQKKVLKADWIRNGMLYVHVAGLEDEFAVAKKADKIVCDSWENVKHRSQTISQMYKLGYLTDNEIHADLGEILLNSKPGRENDEEFIYFNSVGQAAIDVLLAENIYKYALKNNIGLWIEK